MYNHITLVCNSKHMYKMFIHANFDLIRVFGDGWKKINNE